MNIEEDIKYFKTKEAYLMYFQGNPRLEQFVNDLLTKIKELEEENEKEYFELSSTIERIERENKTLKDFNLYISNKKIERDFVSKQKIQDRIDELKISGESNGLDETENKIKEIVIEILQELLEKQ